MKRAQKLISLLCNVKKVSFATKVSSLPISVTLTPNRSQIGAHFKEKTNDVLTQAQGARGRRGVGDIPERHAHQAHHGQRREAGGPSLRHGVQLPGDRRLGGSGQGRDHRRDREGKGRQAHGGRGREGRRKEAPGTEEEARLLAGGCARQGQGGRARRRDRLDARPSEEAPRVPGAGEGGRGAPGAARGRKSGRRTSWTGGRSTSTSPAAYSPEKSWLASDGGSPDSSIFFAALSMSYSTCLYSTSTPAPPTLKIAIGSPPVPGPRLTDGARVEDNSTVCPLPLESEVRVPERHQVCAHLLQVVVEEVGVRRGKDVLPHLIVGRPVGHVEPLSPDLRAHLFGKRT